MTKQHVNKVFTCSCDRLISSTKDLTRLTLIHITEMVDGPSCPLPIEENNTVSIEQASGRLELEQSAFIPPVALASPSIIIEFCDRVRSAFCQSLLISSL